MIKHLSSESVLYHNCSNSLIIAKKCHCTFQIFATLICYLPSEGGYSPKDLKCVVLPKPTFHQNPKVTKNKIKLDNVPQPSKENYKYIARKRKRQREMTCAKNLLQQSLLCIQGQRLLDGRHVFDSLIMTARGVEQN